MESVIDRVSLAFQHVSSMLLYPFWQMYRRGPTRLGCWGGMSNADICMQISAGSSASFWEMHPEECRNIIDKNFDSFAVTTGFFVYGILLYKIASLIWWRYFVVTPVLRDIRNALAQGETPWPPTKTIKSHAADA